MILLPIIIGLILTYFEDPQKVSFHYKSLYSSAVYKLPKLINPLVIIWIILQLFRYGAFVCTEDMKSFIDQYCFGYKQKK